jgi:cytidylate kinase
MREKPWRIAISGKSGCGNTTVSKLLAERLSLRFINFTFRSLAAERNLSLEEVLRLAKDDDSWDRTVDDRQVALARENGGCVLGSRLAIWMLPEASLKVYLRATPETRAQRVLAREGGDLKRIAAFTAHRDAQDRERYLRIYGIDNDIYDFADVVLDVDAIAPGQIVEKILNALGEG